MFKMKRQCRILLGCNILLLFIFLQIGGSATAQDFSNRGTDFWTGYGPHEKISTGVSDMTLYFTSDDTATVTIYVGNALFQTLSIPANSITASNNLPETGAMDARLQNELVYVNKGIYIHSTSPIVAYAQIWGSKVTATTILFPVKTLGRKYTALNYTQISNTSGMRSYIFAVATENGTTVEVKPSATTSAGLVAGTWTSRTMNRGDVWLIKGGTDATDLTGTQIRSVASGANGCKPIAVFSGSQKISVTCTSSTASGDNFFQQSFPMATWGRKFVSSPTAGLNYSYNIYRVMINPDSTSTLVKINGVTLPGSVPGISPAITPLTLGANINMTNSLFYEFATNAPVKIESTSPVMVAQYITNKTSCGNNFSSIGDPDMVYVSPVEQTIDSIIVSPVPTENNDAINYLNVNIKTADVPNFTIRNQANAIVPATFAPMPADPLYSYAQVPIAAGYASNIFYKLKTTTGGFNAIAYGYATSESYAYNAGTNVKNLNHYLTSANPSVLSTETKICKGTPTRVSITLPYIPTSLTYDFYSNPNISPNTPLTITNPTVDNSYVLNGTVLYVFHAPGLYTFNTTGTFPIHVTSNNPSPDGCNGVEELLFDLQVIGGPLANFNWNFSGCATNAVAFSNLSTDSINTINTWQWDFGNGTGTSTLASPSYTYGAGGAFNVHLTVYNNEGCYDDTTRVFTINNSPSADFTFTGITCVGNSINFTDQSSILGGVIAHWYWDFGDGVRDTFTVSTNPVHVYTASGNYTVTLIVDNVNGCRSTKTINVVVGNRPIPNFNLPGNVCLPGNSATFINTSTVTGGGVMTYSWNFGDASATSNQTSPVHNYNTTGPFSVTLTASLGTCSKDTTKIFNTLYTKPTASFTVNAANCLNVNTQCTDASISVNSIITNWSWTFGDGGTSNAQSPSHLYTVAGSYTIKLIVTTDKGCIDSTTRVVIINPLPTANFSVSTPICETQSVTFSDLSVANAGNIVEWSWNFGDGNQQVNSSPAAVTHTYTTAGNFTVTLTVKTDLGCYSTITSNNIIVSPMPNTAFTYPLSLCAPGVVSFTNGTTIADGSLAQMIYAWDFGEGNGYTDASINPGHNFTAGGQYNVLLSATSNNGCTKIASHLISVYTTPVAGFTVSNVGNICSNTALNIINTSNVTGFGVVTKIEIYWDYIINPSDMNIDNSPVVNGTYAHAYPVFGNPLTKTYRVLIKAYNGSGCSSEFFTDVTIHASPQIQFNPLASVCQESNPFAITAASNTTGLTGTGVYSGNGISSGSIFNPSSANVGTNVLTYTFTGANGCVSSANGSIIVNPTPVLNLGPNLNVLEGDHLSLSPVQVSGAGLNYLWSPQTYLSSINIMAPVCTPVDDITYSLAITTSAGCTTTDDLFIKVVKDFIVPNTFTPNGDGINDFWVIENLALYPNSRLQVFNRYGQILYDSKKYTGDWDGTYKNKPLPSGTYYYIIDLNGVRVAKKGYVTIVR